MALFGVVKATGLSPDTVREWSWTDTVHFLAYCEEEAEEARRSAHPPGARGASAGSTTRIHKLKQRKE